ncbi:MAG: MoaD/ThiS family protein [Nitriliruptorales bacterium]
MEVRIFAGLADAAGLDRTTVEPGPVPDVLAELRDRFGEPFTSWLARSQVLVNGERVGQDAGEVEVEAGDEVVLLPPFAGG